MKNGIFRPGAMLMVSSATLSMVAFGVPLFFAALQPTHEWSFFLTGFPAFCLSISGTVLATMYIIGFFQYCLSKGYGMFLTFWLLLSNFPGFVVLLLLPDLKSDDVTHRHVSITPHNATA